MSSLDSLERILRMHRESSAGIGEAAQTLAGGIRQFKLQEDMPSIVEDFTAGNYAGAIGKLAKHNPDILQHSALDRFKNDPAVMEQLTAARELGPLKVQTAFGVNPRQLAELGLQQKQQLASGKLSEKDNRFAEVQANKITSSKFYNDYREVQNRTQQIEEFAANPTAFGDVASVFGFMKTIDPTSVVRESEFATAAESGSLLDRAKNLLSKAEKGERLQPEQRADLVRAARHVVSLFKNQYVDAVTPIYKQAEKRGINPDLIDPFYDDTVKAMESRKAKKSGGIGLAPGTLVRNKKTGKMGRVQPDGSIKETN